MLTSRRHVLRVGLFALAAGARSFEVRSGDCRLEMSTPYPNHPLWMFPKMEVGALCVKQPSRKGDCTIAAPKLPLVVKRLSIKQSDDYLNINGVEYTNAPSAFVPDGDLVWRGNSSSFEVCRPFLPGWTYFFTAFVGVLVYVSGFWLFLWSRTLTLVAFSAAGCATIVGLIVFLYTWDGYSFEDKFFPGGPFVLDAEFLAWFLFWPAVPVIVAASYLFFKTRAASSRRTASFERNLRAALKDGCIRLISVEWLLRQPDEFVLKRRQELPEDAFVPNERAVTLLSERRVAVLSYRWLTAEHPDKFPGSDGFHMTAVRDFLRRGLTWLEWVSLMWHGGEFSSPKALFWDYASLHQKDKNGQKTEVETAQFKKALDVMTYVYASPNTLVLQHRNLPEGFTHTTYEMSGWCTMEDAAASLMTEAGGSLYVLTRGWKRTYAVERRTPEKMASIFRDENQTKFFGSADRELVADLYKKLHTELLKFDRVRKPLLIRIADAIVAWLGIDCTVKLFWMFMTFAILFAISFALAPSPALIWLGCVFCAVVSLVFLPSRNFRWWHTRTAASCCFCHRLVAKTRVSPGGAPATKWQSL